MRGARATRQPPWEAHEGGSPYAGGRRGKECVARYERSNDWRRGAAGSPDPDDFEADPYLQLPDPEDFKADQYLLLLDSDDFEADQYFLLPDLDDVLLRDEEFS